MSIKTLTLTTLILTFIILTTTVHGNSPTVYDILNQYSLPIGLLPNSVKSYTFSPDDGSFSVELDQPCYIQFDYLVYYASKITGKLNVGSITELSGIQVKRFLFWFNVDEIKVDLPTSDSIYFSVGIINKKLDIDQFESVRSCTDNALCGGFIRGAGFKLPMAVDEVEMLITE